MTGPSISDELAPEIDVQKFRFKSAYSRSSGLFWPGLIVTTDEALSEEGGFALTPPNGDSIAPRLVARDHTTNITRSAPSPGQ